MPDPALTPEQYVDQSGIPCPGCGDTRFVHYRNDDDTQITPNSVWVGVSCTECKATWDDEYALTGYTNLKLEGADA